MAIKTPQTRPASPEHEGWRLTFGANVVDGGVLFRVWAPDADRIDLELDGIELALAREDGGVWSRTVHGAGEGARYRYRIDRGGSFPDPYSRSQPEGPHGASEVIDPYAHEWQDDDWNGITRDGLVIYECHVGIHTPDGTFDALIGDLDALRDLGVNAIELMPIADFPGTRNWGYDGVNLFAPTRNYGGAAALKRFVDAAHARGIGVILDVVYNHFGPDGNYLLQFSPHYLTDRHKTPWGDAINYDGEMSERVRHYVVDNACYWIQEYHIDGLRLDATFTIIDESPRHILADITSAAHGVTGRGVVVLAETFENDVRYVTPVEDGGLGVDAVWSDDFHHGVHTAASHDHSGYYKDYDGSLRGLAATINRGWLFEGQYSRHLESHRGTRADDVGASRFVYFIQNHDQVGNRAFGRRLSHLIGAAATRPWSALLLLLPYTPMLFAGQEFAASSRFHYFTDHNEELGRAITAGRRTELAQSGAQIDPEIEATLPDPQAPETFLESKLNLMERHEGVGEQMFALYRELIALRRNDSVLQRQDRGAMQAIAASNQLLLVHTAHGDEERLIVLNTGVAIDATPEAAGVPEDIARLPWEPVISTEERRFGGTNDQVRFDGELIALPPQSATFFAASARGRRARVSIRGRVSGLIARFRRR